VLFRSSIAIGISGLFNQGMSAIGIGNYSAFENQFINAIAIGNSAGSHNQGTNAISIGYQSGSSNQGQNAIAIGYQAGRNNQGTNAVAIGFYSGKTNQGQSSISIGYQAGQTIQGTNAIAIGYQAGQYIQGTNAVAIGYQSGSNNQKAQAVAIGYQAGQTNQGINSIAIGYYAGCTNQPANSIAINATNTKLLYPDTSGCFIAPIRIANADGFSATPSLLMYDTLRNEIAYSTASTTQAKTFVIDHPTDHKKYLVHACLEGPEGGVYYRGTGEITNNEYIEIELPDYASHIATEFSILLTKIRTNKNKKTRLETSKIIGNKFTVYGENTEFYWFVYGKRQNIEVEPLKAKTKIQGSGPYKWI
jgi:hypothetical protein